MTVGEPRTLKLESCLVDLDRRLVLRGPIETGLTQQEVGLLRYLAARAGEVVRREELLQEVWGYKPGVASRAVDSTVIRLRGKIERDPAEPRHLRSSYGHGYVLELPEPPPSAPEPGIRTISAPGQTNLVRAQDPIIGRNAEIQALSATLSGGPGLVTLVGPGGVGKTRTAREVGTRLIGALKGGVWFVPLAELTDAAGMSVRIAETLGIELGRATTPEAAEAQLASGVAARGACLLLLDNLEQLGAGASAQIRALLSQAPALRVLATSRSPLSAEGEQVTTLAPLPSEDAAALFELRARKVRPGFRVGGPNQAAVSELVKRLDYLPLALELAAAWADVLPPERLLKRLEASASLPVRRPGEGRHDSLERMLDWSWNMLTAEQRQTLSGCSVFRGGFDLEAAEAVLGSGDGALADLEALRQRSLLQFEHAPGRPDEPRFSLLHVVVDHASARLEASLDGARYLRAHREWYLNLGERLAAAVQGANPERLPELCLELDNLLAVVRRTAGVLPGLSARAALAAEPALLRRGPFSERLNLLQDACDQARRFGDPALLAQVLIARSDAERLLGRLGEAERWLAEAQDLAGTLDDPALQSAAELGMALVAYERGDFDTSVERSERARAASLRCGDRFGQADALRALGQAELGRGRLAQADASSGEALRLLGGQDSRREALILRNLGMIAIARGDSVLGRAQLEASLQRDRALGNAWGELLTLPNLGNACFDLGDLRRADRVYAEALSRARAMGYRRVEGALLVNAGALARTLGDLPRARELLGEALAIASAFGHQRAQAYALTNLAVVLHEEGDLTAACQRYTDATAMLQTLGDPTQLTWCCAAHAVARAERGALDEARAALAEITLVRDRVSDRVTSVTALAEAAVQLAEGGEPEAARAALATHGSPTRGKVEAQFIASRVALMLRRA